MLVRPHTVPSARSTTKHSSSLRTSWPSRASFSNTRSSYRLMSVRPDTSSGGAGGAFSPTGGGGGGGDGLGESSVALPWLSVVTSCCELIKFSVNAMSDVYISMSERTCSSSSRSACPVVSSS